MATTNQIIDTTNQPSIVILNSIQLPIDVTISLDDEKVIAESKILDGVSVYERVSRKPFNIDLNFTIREQNALGQYIFGQKTAATIITSIWQIDEVVPVVNSFLNKLGINEIIIKNITFATDRGTTNILCSLKCLENYNSNGQQTSLIVDFTL